MLLAFSPQNATPTAAALARAAGVPLSTVYRYLTLLRDHGLVADGSGGRYHLTPRLYSLAEAARSANPLELAIGETLARLRDDTGECALFIRRVGDFAVCTQIAETEQPIRLSFALGHPMPLDGGAGAKLLLATMPAEARARYLAANVGAVRRKELTVELDRIAAKRWTTSEGEVDGGVWATAALVQERGNVAGVVSVAGPAFRLSAANRTRIIQRVRLAVEGLA